MVLPQCGFFIVVNQSARGTIRLYSEIETLKLHEVVARDFELQLKHFSNITPNGLKKSNRLKYVLILFFGPTCSFDKPTRSNESVYFLKVLVLILYNNLTFKWHFISWQYICVTFSQQKLVCVSSWNIHMDELYVFFTLDHCKGFFLFRICP